MARQDEIKGLREFRRDLKRLAPETDKELRKEFRGVGKKVAQDASAHAVKRTGEYARNFKVSVTAKGVSVVNRLPQADVLHWGGTIRPRGVPIKFPRRPVIWDAIERQENQIYDGLGDAIDRAARQVGWR